MNKERITVAVTGGIGSGKSTVMRLIEKQSYKTFSCDELYKEVAVSQEYLLKIKELFPLAITKAGTLDRKKLSQIVFNDKSLLAKLNGISHPLILKKLNEKIEQEKGLVFCEVPLLFESGWQDKFDFVIIVSRPLESRVSSVCARDHMSESDALKRIGNQFNYESLLGKLPDNYFLLENMGTEEELQGRVLELIENLLTRK